MSTYGRFFEPRVSPQPEQRMGQFCTGATAIPQGAPVRKPAGAVAVRELDGRTPLELATAASPAKIGETGILAWENPWPNVQLSVPAITRSSDFIDAPKNTPVQVWHGTIIEVVFRNITAEDLEFEGQAEYAGRNMVNPADLAAMELGKLLTPGDGNDTDGYWKVTSTASEAWLRVVDFDKAAGFTVAQMLF